MRDRGVAGLGWSLAYGVDAERGAGLSWRRTGQFIVLEASREFEVQARVLPVVIIGGLKFGAFTPTEAAVIATVYSLFFF